MAQKKPFVIPSVQETFLVLGMFGLALMLILPMPNFLFDLGISANLVISLLILFVSLYVRCPSDFSSLANLMVLTSVMRIVMGLACIRALIVHGPAGEIPVSFFYMLMAQNHWLGLVYSAAFMLMTLCIILFGLRGLLRQAAKRDQLGIQPIRAAFHWMQWELIASVLVTVSMAALLYYDMQDGRMALMGSITDIARSSGDLESDIIFMIAFMVVTELAVRYLPAFAIAIAVALIATRTNPDVATTAENMRNQLLKYPYAWLFTAGCTLLISLTFFITLLPWYPFLVFTCLLVVVALGVWMTQDAQHEVNRSPEGTDALAEIKSKTGE